MSDREILLFRAAMDIVLLGVYISALVIFAVLVSRLIGAIREQSALTKRFFDDPKPKD